jgi:tRNA pseudouridine13 synthase
MREAHPRERATGVDWYASDADGTGGRLRDRPADFRVRELEAFDAEPVDADPGAYPHLVLRVTLRGWDTNDFADALSDRLGISRERVSWAGTKDKHAVTTQLFSLDGVDPAALPGDDEFDGVDVELVGRAGRPILFGDLAGNAFQVVVRDADRPDQVQPVTGELQEFAHTDDGRVGVPNVFGPQRFGTRRPVTHEVGLAIVRGDWEAAVRTYVCERDETEPDDTRQARAAVDDRWGERTWGDLADSFPGRLRHERSLLYGLAETGGETPADFRAALERFPTNLQRLLVNAAQSYAFNRMLSRRLERGLPFHEAVAGDVVCFRDRAARSPASRSSSEGRSASLGPRERCAADRREAASCANGASREQASGPRADGERERDATDESVSDGRAGGAREQSDPRDGPAAPAGVELPDTDRLQRVDADRVETVNRHCARGRAFVTAPLVGTDTEFADGEQGEIERAVLDDLGVERADFDLPGEFGSEGTRRAILVRTALEVDRDPLTLSFRLPKGSYATTVLREYLKVDPMRLA